MNLTIKPHSAELTESLRSAVEDAVAEALDVLDAPPETPVAVDLRGPKKEGSKRHRAKAVIELPEERLKAKGTGPGLLEAVAVMRGALVRRAHQWMARRAVPAGFSDTPLLRGAPVSDQALRAARRPGGPGENIIRKTDHRPPGNR